MQAVAPAAIGGHARECAVICTFAAGQVQTRGPAWSGPLVAGRGVAGGAEFAHPVAVADNKEAEAPAAGGKGGVEARGVTATESSLGLPGGLKRLQEQGRLSTSSPACQRAATPRPPACTIRPPTDHPCMQ